MKGGYQLERRNRVASERTDDGVIRWNSIQHLIESVLENAIDSNPQNKVEEAEVFLYQRLLI